MEDLTKILKKYRVANSLKQDAMAIILKIGYRTYQDIEKTGKVKKLDDYNRILVAIGITQKNADRAMVPDTSEDIEGTLIAIKSAIKILTLKIISLESRVTKKPFEEVSLKTEKMMKEERRRMTDELKQS